MTTQNNEVHLLRMQVFNFAQEFHTLYSAYQGLQVIALSASVDSENVGAVINGLNYRFESLLIELDKLYQKNEGTFLRVVD